MIPSGAANIDYNLQHPEGLPGEIGKERSSGPSSSWQLPW
jgi:hypothetical protein